MSKSDSERVCPVDVKHITKATLEMLASAALFELHGPGEARAESQHRREHNGWSVFLEPQAFLQPLAVLRHVQLPLLGAAGNPRHQLPVDHHLLFRAHEHLPELLQPPLHFPDDTLTFLHLQEAPPGRLELHAGAGRHELGRGGRGRGGRRVGAGQQRPRHPAEVAHGDGAPGGRGGQSQHSGGGCGRRHG